MTNQLRSRQRMVGPGGVAVVLAVAGVMAACAGGPPDIPTPRSIVNYSGARVRVDVERMKEVNECYRLRS